MREPERIGLVGLSLGGNIAQEIVHRDPGRIAAMVVADSTCNTAARHSLQVPMTIASLSIALTPKPFNISRAIA